MQTKGQDKALTPNRFSLFIAIAIFLMSLADAATRSPDTVDGVVVHWDTALRVGGAGLLALFGFAASFLATRSRMVIHLSRFRAVVIIALYALYAYLPPLVDHRVSTVQIENGIVVEAPLAFWFSLLEPLLLPYLLVMVVVRLSIPRRGPRS